LFLFRYDPSLFWIQFAPFRTLSDREATVSKCKDSFIGNCLPFDTPDGTPAFAIPLWRGRQGPAVLQMLLFPLG